MMNWKVLCLLPGLTLAASVPVYANPTSNSQTTHSATLIAQSEPQNATPNASPAPTTDATPNDSGTTTKPDATPSDSGTMKKPHARTHSGAMTKNSTGALKIGSRGEAVKTVQTFLKQQNLYTGPINGKFGHQTQLAVMKFQKSKGLRADGVIGPQTQAAMQ